MFEKTLILGFAALALLGILAYLLAQTNIVEQNKFGITGFLLKNLGKQIESEGNVTIARHVSIVGNITIDNPSFSVLCQNSILEFKAEGNNSIIKFENMLTSFDGTKAVRIEGASGRISITQNTIVLAANASKITIGDISFSSKQIKAIITTEVPNVVMENVKIDNIESPGEGKITIPEKAILFLNEDLLKISGFHGRINKIGKTLLLDGKVSSLVITGNHTISVAA